jgi:hypothetical protein
MLSTGYLLKIYLVAAAIIALGSAAYLCQLLWPRR